VVKQENEILLGETKYYAVKKKTETGELKIEEIKVIQDIAPVFPSTAGEGWEWINKKSIWSDRPINIETKGQIPIFYDKFYAQLFYSGNSKPIINDLPDGMIRVIGRYLGKTIDNKVKLFTEKENGRNDTINIQVVRPTKLGDSDNMKSGPTKEGGFKEYNIDSLIINVAGITGILPQIIKAIMKNESIQFKPSYRYEIFQDFGGNIRNVFDSTHTYWIKSKTDEGYPQIPQNHGTIMYGTKTSKDGYPKPTYAWTLLMDKEYYNLYFKRDSTVFVIDPSDSSTTAISAYKSERNKIMEFYNSYFNDLKKRGMTDGQAKDSAKIKTQQRYLLYLRKDYGGIGMGSLYAQTRIVASYGLMQLTYYGGVSSYKKNWNLNYPDNDINYLPENLNIIPINVEFGTKHFLGKMRFALGSIGYHNEDTWDKNHGFELTYWKGLSLYNNGNSSYPNPIFKNAKNYIPKK
jgi:hypothetical protein